MSQTLAPTQNHVNHCIFYRFPFEKKNTHNKHNTNIILVICVSLNIFSRVNNFYNTVVHNIV